MAERTRKTTTLSREPQGRTGADESWGEGASSALTDGDLGKTHGVGRRGEACPDGATSRHRCGTACKNRFSRLRMEAASLPCPASGAGLT